MTETTNYRRLGRNGPSLFQRARSVSTFVLLLVVVVCVFFAYQYMNNSAELSTFRVDFEQSNALNEKLKNEMLELNVKLEKLKLSEQQCHEKGEETNRKLEACQTENVKNIKLADERVHINKIDCEKNVSELRTQLDSTKSQMEVLKQMHDDQVANLTQTVEQLRADLATLRRQNPSSLNDADPALMNGTGIRSEQQLTASMTTSSNSTGSGRPSDDDQDGQHRRVVGNGVAAKTHSETAKVPQTKRGQHAQNDARERLDKSDEQQQQQQYQQKESDNEKGIDNGQQQLMGAGGRVRLEEIAAEAAKRDGGAGGNVRGELLQAAAAAQQKEEDSKEHHGKEDDGENAMLDKADGEADDDEPPKKRKPEQQQLEEEEKEE